MKKHVILLLLIIFTGYGKNSNRDIQSALDIVPVSRVTETPAPICLYIDYNSSDAPFSSEPINIYYNAKSSYQGYE